VRRAGAVTLRPFRDSKLVPCFEQAFSYLLSVVKYQTFSCLPTAAGS
jgi:hypothetical protein